VQELDAAEKNGRAYIPHPDVRRLDVGSWRLFAHQMRAMLYKRMHNFKRNKKAFVSEVRVRALDGVYCS
jgi:hypothetical protein